MLWKLYLKYLAISVSFPCKQRGLYHAADAGKAAWSRLLSQIVTVYRDTKGKYEEKVRLCR